MRLYDEEELRTKNYRSKKVKNYILIGIIVTVILIIVLIGAIYYLIYNPNKITIYLDGHEDATLESIFEFRTSEDGTTIIYTPIRTTATKFGYKSNDGEYTTNFEDRDSCYIESENEVAIFSLDSNIIYKINKTTQKSDSEYEYEEIKIENPIVRENDALYVDGEGLQKAFNIAMSYNTKSKRVDIRTLNDLVLTAKNKVIKYGTLDERFVNQKAILDNMMVIASNGDNLMGVRNFETGEEILGAQYDDIIYIPQKSAFLVKKNNKVGIIGNDGIIKIRPQYDNLTLIDNENELYLAENNGLYGVIDENENIKIYLEYTKIGVDISKYSANGLKNGYILLGKLIPVQQNGKWIFFVIEITKNEDGTKNLQCNQIQNVDFDDIGCISKTTRGTVANLMVIEDYNVVVVQKYGYYGFMDLKGKPALGLTYTDAYMETTSGKVDYYTVDREGKTLSVTEELEKRGYTKKEN